VISEEPIEVRDGRDIRDGVRDDRDKRYTMRHIAYLWQAFPPPFSLPSHFESPNGDSVWLATNIKYLRHFPQ